MSLSKNIAQYCKQKNMPLSALARKAKVPKATLHGWMTGRRALNLDQLRRVADTLEISLYQLLFSADDPNICQRMNLKRIFSGDVRVVIERIQ